MTERKWSRPALIILGRGRPEESVLVVCKFHDASIIAVDKPYCGWQATDGTSGHPCHGVTGS